MEADICFLTHYRMGHHNRVGISGPSIKWNLFFFWAMWDMSYVGYELRDHIIPPPLWPEFAPRYSCMTASLAVCHWAIQLELPALWASHSRVLTEDFQ